MERQAVRKSIFIRRVLCQEDIHLWFNEGLGMKTKARAP